MRLLNQESTDVLVIGAGIAGISAAVSAAEHAADMGISCKVTLVSYGKTFSGSSFSKDTWGLGMIAPATPAPEDVADLVHEICAVGAGAANPSLVASFVEGMYPTLQKLEAEGVKLLKPKHAGEREFIPCFDSKHRLWRGFESEAYQQALAPKLSALSIRCRESWELVDLLEKTFDRAGEHDLDDENVSHALSCSSKTPIPTEIVGALFFDHDRQEFVVIRARAVVLATGGFANLFSRALGAPDNVATAHAIAARHGVDLVNIECMQIMPTLIGAGEGRVFNEKMFRFAVLDEEQCQSIDLSAEIAFWSTEKVGSKSVECTQDNKTPCTARTYLESLLDARGGYGPFTSRLQSRGIDFAMAAVGEAGLRVRFALPEGPLPEFAERYFAWLASETGLTAEDSVRIVPAAHAANGGIRIGPCGETCVPGLFAAGEVTGGMHGADRIGGLASASAFVFGLRAGEAALDYALAYADNISQLSVYNSVTHGLTEERYCSLYQQLQSLMTTYCMIIRSEEGLTQALANVRDLRQASQTYAVDQGVSPYEHLLYMRLQNQLFFAELFIESALQRTESLGSHYRAD